MTTLQLMRLPVEQNLPSGLLDDKVEIFYHFTNVYALQGGCLIEFYDWSEELYCLVEGDMAKHPAAIQALIDLGIEKRLEMLWQYCRCRFGSFDSQPDITEDGLIKHTEYWDCGFRGRCPYEGKLCSSIKAPFGIITWREIDIIKGVAADKMAKEIADELGISETTVPVHKQNIFKKIGITRSGELVKWAMGYNIN